MLLTDRPRGFGMRDHDEGPDTLQGALFAPESLAPSRPARPPGQTPDPFAPPARQPTESPDDAEATDLPPARESAARPTGVVPASDVAPSAARADLTPASADAAPPTDVPAPDVPTPLVPTGDAAVPQPTGLVAAPADRDAPAGLVSAPAEPDALASPAAPTTAPHIADGPSRRRVAALAG